MMSRVCLLLIAVACTGCLLVGGGKKTRFDESIRYFVSFESPQAADDFHAGLRRSSREEFTDGRGFALLFVAVGGRAVFHETEHFNAQVRRADFDRDGLITDREASNYLAQVRDDRAARPAKD